jgi:hypothetical protein
VRLQPSQALLREAPRVSSVGEKSDIQLNEM